MIKFLHAADLHLDSPFAALPPRQAAQQRQEQRRLLTLMSELCRQNHCQLMLLSGDLFDGQWVYRDTIDALRSALSDCGAEVFISPGNHDALTSTSPYFTEAWPDNVHIFTSAKPEAIYLDALGCAVYGAAFTTPTMAPMLRNFHVPQEGINYVNLMVLHGDAQLPSSPYNSITKDDIAESGLNYLALGHIHQASSLCRAGQTHYAWPGCPMGRGFDETGKKGILLGELDKNTVHVQFYPLDLRQYEILQVEAGVDPLKSILAALPENTQANIYRILLTGESDGVDLSSLYSQLEERFFALQLRDQTEPPLDLWIRSGEDTLQGLSLHTLKLALERCETLEQRRCIELAARRIAQVCEGREVPAL